MDYNKLDSLMALCAFRYCINRKTYVVKHCVEWLLHNWILLEEQDKTIILKETQEALQSDTLSPIDRQEWQYLIDTIHGGH